MLTIEKYAAIDIGSNAIRLLIANVIEQENSPTLFKKNELIRVPIRLGEDVFSVGEISEKNKQRMIDAMQAFRLLMNAHQVKYYRACATSAMREASNGDEVVQIIKETSSVEIEIIDGKEEAAIIAATDLYSVIEKDKVYLYVDVGGGSTECTLYDQGEVKVSKSFKIGTVRILKNLVDESKWVALSDWIKEHTNGYSKITVIGSGGNINKIIKMNRKKSRKSLSYLNMLNFYEMLDALSYDERVVKLGLNPDRADVIIPALEIYLRTMKWSNAEHIVVPSIGLSDGIIKTLYKTK
ncbi:exopolyphosphatase [Dokdonia pacifica]|uniref:Exopolyphosphatase / guanosine-5'-triphosphate,3'-diphosphate pyrophosphatase n=1 Tax=Dokdonia pacifica TaxID=1627892 RepID=A0A239CL40_9FLAO|nr:exopolyphosphatase [Dokdonia pacifica]GGG38607.1 exopolyphosphatase [Dokdonia pacifica]SNS20877.1 exopolyphosphatase / guanosine-5'-triphosphate,3'-diphosphate pyrophosphatase [Dokdonia pacifica]